MNSRFDHFFFIFSRVLLDNYLDNFIVHIMKYKKKSFRVKNTNWRSCSQMKEAVDPARWSAASSIRAVIFGLEQKSNFFSLLQYLKKYVTIL